jgi:hypothetical protein
MNQVWLIPKGPNQAQDTVLQFEPGLAVAEVSLVSMGVSAPI